MEWSKVKSTQFKLVLAGVGASAVVAMGALGATVAAPTESVGTVSQGASEEPSTTPVTSFAEPSVKAELPDGYDQEPD